MLNYYENQLKDAGFILGADVIIKDRGSRASYNNSFKNRIGTISRISGGKLGITFKNVDNPRSKYNCFWYSYNEVSLFQGVNKEKIENIIGVNLEFKGNCINKTSVPFECYDKSIKIGDWVVAKTLNHGFQVATVTKIIDWSLDTTVEREVVCKIDFTGYQERKDKIKKLKSIKSKMRDRIKIMDELTVFETLSKNDEELKNLLTEYKQLND